MRALHDPDERVCILGAGFTGLAAGLASGRPVFEAVDVPGGICASYYVRPGTTQRLATAPADGQAYRFEIGGGHWIFGGDPAVLRLIRTYTPIRVYQRRSAVHLRARERIVPYPLQHHLSRLDRGTAAAALQEILHPPGHPVRTLEDWITARLGQTLTRIFFGPFHERYTAGLWKDVAPQDAYKSPVDPSRVIRGALGEGAPVGYNIEYVYPEQGLDVLARAMAADADVRYGHRVVRVDTERRVVFFENEAPFEYDRLLSTLPLAHMLDLTGLAVEEAPGLYTSVLVLNVGAERGPSCPDDHWIYVPDSASGFHRVGFYSNVDPSFLPAAARAQGDRVGLYVERAFRSGERPTGDALAAYVEEALAELQDWGFIGLVDVADPTWIEVAYTWNRPGSLWRERALAALDERDIVMVGRYGRWTFQGIADSIRDGLVAGTIG